MQHCEFQFYFVFQLCVKHAANLIKNLESLIIIKYNYI